MGYHTPVGLPEGTLKPANDDQDEQPEEEEEEYDETHQKFQMLLVKLLRLARRLGKTPNHDLVIHVFTKFLIARQFNTTKGAFSPALSFPRACAMAERLESSPGTLDLACTILVIGKSGSGKTSTLNSIFDKPVFAATTFGPGTSKIQDHVGTLHGINVRVIDTPGLSLSDQKQNEKTLRSVKSFLKKTPPDVVLYVDRLDTCGGEFCADKALMWTITSVFGQSFWSNVIVVLTHAASPPPDYTMETQIDYNYYETRRKQIVQKTIRDASGDMLLNFFSLVENHSGCRTNMAGQPVLPNGQVWKHELLLLCFALTILSKANITLPKFEPPPHLPSLLSSFLQSRPQVVLPTEQFGCVVVDDDDDDDLDSGSGSDSEEDEYDKLPPFKRLTKRELEKLSRSQRNAYYDEIEYREKLFMRKEIKEKKRQRKLTREMRETQEETETGPNEENNSPNPWIVVPVCEPIGWDQGTGIIGVQVEKVFVVKERIPISLAGEVWRGTNNKTNIFFEIASSIKHGKGKSTSLGFDIQPSGYDDKAFTIRGETLFSNRGMNKVSAGVTATLLVGGLSGGVKLVDKLSLGRWVELEGSAGANCSGRGNAAYGGGLEVRVMDRDNPLGRFLTTFGLDVTEGHGEVGLGGRVVVQVPIGRHDKMVARINVDKGGFGKLGFSVGGSDRVQIALIFLIPLVKKLLFSVGSAWV